MKYGRLYSGVHSKTESELREERFDREKEGAAQRHMKPLAVREWLAVLIILVIPGVNVAAPLYWAYGNSRTQLRPFARAVLIFEALALLGYIVFRLLMSCLDRPWMP